MASPAQLVAGARAAGLDLIAITDHDTMRNAREVRERGEEAGLAVVEGQEITTRWPAQTHLVGWFLAHPIRSGLSLEATVDAIHAQGGLAVIPHPFMPTYFASCQPAMLARLIADRRLDGIEVLHTAPMTSGRRRQLAVNRPGNLGGSGPPSVPIGRWGSMHVRRHSPRDSPQSAGQCNHLRRSSLPGPPQH
jgi:hypothetical protein